MGLVGCGKAQFGVGVGDKIAEGFYFVSTHGDAAVRAFAFMHEEISRVYGT